MMSLYENWLSQLISDCRNMGKRNRQKRSKQSAEGEMPVKPSIQEMVEVFTLVKAVLESKLVNINCYSTFFGISRFLLFVSRI